MSFSFWPKTIFQTQSKISGEIKVKEQLDQYTLQVQNLTQSGGIIKSIWQKPLKKVKNAERVLLLGLGGGTVVHLIKERFPEVKITALEIDSEIIKIGKKYFGLEKVKNLKIINTEAIKWVFGYDISKYRSKFDLILVDLYLGEKFPKKAMNDQFLKNLKKILAPQGTVILNWLKNKEAKEIKQKFTSFFPEGEYLDLKTNLFLIGHL
jgi:spermidine synthase